MKKLTAVIILIALLFTLVACSPDVGGTGGTGGTGGVGDTGDNGGNGGTQGDEPKEHVHSYTTVWSSDETHHWRAANCEHTDLVTDKAEHSFKDGYCSVCKAEDKSVQHQHKFSDGWTGNDEYHWHAAICEHATEVSGKALHTFANGRCSVCQALDPNYTDYPYEFGDAVSINNSAFYKDYSDEEKQLYYTLWSENTTVSIKIDISPFELAKINEAYSDYTKGNTLKADTYRKCNLTIVVNGVEYYYEEVGIRMRGNTSRRYFVDSNGNVNNYVHFRFSLSETFDGDEYAGNAWGNEIYHDWSSDAKGRKARKDRSFATMEKFYYKWNKNYDQTYIREVYANRMFQAYGILAPHITLTQISISQNSQMESLGVGNLYETIDKAFIKRNFSKARKGGDLYKCTFTNGPADLTTYGGGLYGVETPTQRFTYSLKTNDDRSAPDYTHNAYLKAFIDMLKTDQKATDFKSKLEAMVDMDYFARFEAVNYLLGNPDCIRNNSNNYYIYFVPVEDELYYESDTYIVPYDYDRCLGANMDWNPQESMVKATPYATKGWNGDCKNPLYIKTILASGSNYRAMYTGAIRDVLNGEWFTYDNYQKLYNAYEQNYGDLAMPSQTIKNQCGKSVKISRFVFSETESSDIGSSSDNLTVKMYFQQKRTTATNNLDK